MSLKIAEVAIPVSITLNRFFDYLIPSEIAPKIAIGSRVLVPFGPRVMLGYIVKMKEFSGFSGLLKSVIKPLDEEPVLNNEQIALAYKISENYFCSIADALHTVIPSGLKKSKAVTGAHEFKEQLIPKKIEITEKEETFLKLKGLKKSVIILSALSASDKWLIYSALIKKALQSGKSVIFLVPDHRKIESAVAQLGLDIQPYILTSQIKPNDTLNTWCSIKKNNFSFIAGTRSAVFAPVNNLGLIVIDEEEHFAYRQDQVPHYRTLEIALERAKLAQARVVAGSFVSSIEAYQLSTQKDASFISIPASARNAKVCILDISKEFRFKAKARIISKILEFRIATALEKKEKILIFVPQKGFSTFLYCQHCKKVQTCPRCSCSLSFSFKEKMVSCTKCPYKEKAEDLCPSCRRSYVRYSGYGTEKVESELLRLFPSAKISIYSRESDEAHSKEWSFAKSDDIMLATQEIFEAPNWSSSVHDNTCVLDLEKMLIASDFRSSEHIFAKLLKLLFLAKKELWIQARYTDNENLKFLQAFDVEAFLKYELDLRKELNLPPIKQQGVFLIRSKSSDKTLKISSEIYKKLKKSFAKISSAEIFAPIEARPFKVRGNYRFEILIKYDTLDAIHKTIWDIMRQPKSGIITTFDPSPL